MIVCHVPPFPHWFQWIRGGSKRRAAAAPPRRKQVRWVSRTGSRPPRASNSADLGTCVGRRRSGLRRGRLARQIRTAGARFAAVRRRHHQEGQPHHRLTEEGLRGSVRSRSAASAVMLHRVNKVLTLLGQIFFFFHFNFSFLQTTRTLLSVRQLTVFLHCDMSTKSKRACVLVEVFIQPAAQKKCNHFYILHFYFSIKNKTKQNNAMYKMKTCSIGPYCFSHYATHTFLLCLPGFKNYFLVILSLKFDIYEYTWEGNSSSGDMTGQVYAAH